MYTTKQCLIMSLYAIPHTDAIRVPLGQVQKDHQAAERLLGFERLKLHAVKPSVQHDKTFHILLRWDGQRKVTARTDFRPERGRVVCRHRRNLHRPNESAVCQHATQIGKPFCKYDNQAAYSNNHLQ